MERLQATQGWDPGELTMFPYYIPRSSMYLSVTGLGTPNFGKLKKLLTVKL